MGAGALLSARQAEESLEHLLEFFGRYPGAVVSDEYLNLCPVHGHFDFDGLFDRRVPHGVANQVLDHGAQ